MLNSPLVGIIISLFSYIVGCKISEKIKSPLLNKFIVAISISMVAITLLKVDKATFQVGGNFVLFFLPIVVISLAIPLYNYRSVILKYKWIFLTSIVFGISLNFALVYIFVSFFDLPFALKIAVYTKSITTPMASSVHEILNADKNIAVLLVTIASFVAGILGKLIVKLTRVKNDFSKGLAMGLFSHVIGSIVAFEESNEAGAVAIITFTLAGVITVIILPILVNNMII